MFNKALAIAEDFYTGYSLLFWFHNDISHSVYAKNALRTTQMNKKVSGKQLLFFDSWFKKDRVCIT